MRLTRRALLAGAASGGVLSLGRARGAEPAAHLFVIVANGAWDPTFVFDAKPGRGDGPFPDQDPERPDDVEQERRFGDVRITTNEAKRPSVTRFFERWGHRTAVVNGLWTGTLSHWDGMLRALTGTSDPDAPDLVARAAATLAPGLPLPALDAAGVGRPGPFTTSTGRTGVRGQLAALVSPAARFPMADGTDRPNAGLDPADWHAIRRFRDARGVAEGRRDAWQRADRLRESAVEIAGHLPGGQRNGLGDDLVMAVSLCEAGISHSALIDSGQSWDTHADAPRQHSCFEALFRALYGLGEGLERRGMLDRSLVLVLSELGRTPSRNAHGGTDHWPYTSALLFGADTRGGTQLGGTDDAFVGLTCDPSTGRPSTSAPDPLTVPNLTAGVLEAVGVAEPLPGVVPLRGFRA